MEGTHLVSYLRIMQIIETSSSWNINQGALKSQVMLKRERNRYIPLHQHYYNHPFHTTPPTSRPYIHNDIFKSQRPSHRRKRLRRQLTSHAFVRAGYKTYGPHSSLLSTLSSTEVIPLLGSPVDTSVRPSLSAQVIIFSILVSTI
jgi:hypothetical protein